MINEILSLVPLGPAGQDFGVYNINEQQKQVEHDGSETVVINLQILRSPTFTRVW